DISCFKYRILSRLFLLSVIIQALHCRTSQQNDHRKVNKSQESHDHVCRTPGNTEFHKRSAEHHYSCKNPEGNEHPFARLFIAQISKTHLCIKVVSDQSRKRKHEQCNGNKCGSKTAQRLRRRSLHPGHPF